MPPKVVAIVLNWNGWLDTIECLESLLRSDYDAYQIVVCDNGSQDHSIERLTEWADGLLEVTSRLGGATDWAYRPAPKPVSFEVFDSPRAALADAGHSRVIFVRNGENLGYAAGNNVGIRVALERLDAEYVWILNNDTVVERTALTHLTDAITFLPDVAILGTRVMSFDAPNVIQALGGGIIDARLGFESQVGRGRTDYPGMNDPAELEHVIGASMFVRSAAIRDVGLIDESYFLYREETDWCISFRKSNWRLMYCPKSVVWHKEGRSVGFKSILHDYYAVRNMLFLIQKHYPQHLATALAVSFCRAALPKIARMQVRRLRYVLKAYADFLRGVRGRTEVNPDAFFVLERIL